MSISQSSWLILLLLAIITKDSDAFLIPSSKCKGWHSLAATVAGQTNDIENSSLDGPDDVKAAVLGNLNPAPATEYADMFGLGATEAGLYALIQAIRQSQVLGLKGVPFVMRKTDLPQTSLEGFFTMKDLEKALEDDFLDAARGSTDNRKGWKVRTARLTWKQQVVSIANNNFFFRFAKRLLLFRILGEILLKKLA